MQSLKDQILQDQKEKRTSDCTQHWGLNKDGAKYAAPHLGKKMCFYFSLVILVTLPLIASLIYEVGSQRLHAQIVESIAGPANTALLSSPVPVARTSESDGVKRILRRLQNQMILVMSAVFLAVMVAIFLFMRRVIKPLDEIGRAAFKMAHGRLDEPVPVRARNEIGKIGELINDLAIDLQEILLHVWNHTRQDIVLMERIAANMSSQPGGNGMPVDIKEDFYFVKQDIEDMRDMVKAFNYYHVRLDEEKVLVNENPRVEGVYHD
jgi:HAMP domain-containing protein